MPSDKLTELGIKKSKSGKKEKKLDDGQGLYLLLHPNSSKYWRVKYRFLGKEKVLALGVWPKISLNNARKTLIILSFLLLSSPVIGQETGVL